MQGTFVEKEVVTLESSRYFGFDDYYQHNQIRQFSAFAKCNATRLHVYKFNLEDNNRFQEILDEIQRQSRTHYDQMCCRYHTVKQALPPQAVPDKHSLTLKKISQNSIQFQPKPTPAESNKLLSEIDIIKLKDNIFYNYTQTCDRNNKFNFFLSKKLRKNELIDFKLPEYLKNPIYGLIYEDVKSQNSSQDFEQIINPTHKTAAGHNKLSPIQEKSPPRKHTSRKESAADPTAARHQQSKQTSSSGKLPKQILIRSSANIKAMAPPQNSHKHRSTNIPLHQSDFL